MACLDLTKSRGLLPELPPTVRGRSRKTFRGCDANIFMKFFAGAKYPENVVCQAKQKPQREDVFEAFEEAAHAKIAEQRHHREKREPRQGEQPQDNHSARGIRLARDTGDPETG